MSKPPTRTRPTHFRRLGLAALSGLLIGGLALAGCSSSGGASSQTSGGGAATGSSGSSGALQTVKLVSYTSGSAAWLGYIGKQKGFFAKDGINLDLVTLPAGAQATTALLSGSLDVANLDLNNLGPALAQGEKFQLLVNEYTNNWKIVAPAKDANIPLNQAISSLKTVGVPSLGGSGTRFTQYLVSAYGGSSSSVKYVADPNGAAMVAGSTDATATDPLGACILENQGFKTIFSFLDSQQPVSSLPAQIQPMVGFPGLSYWASGAWVSKNPTAAADFQKAVQDTITWMKDPANAAEIATLLTSTVWHVSSLPTDKWDACVKSTVQEYDPKFPASAVTTWNTFVKATGVVPNGLPPSSEWLAPGVPQ